MPRYLKQDGVKVKNIRFEKAWIEIPVKRGKCQTQLDSETYLVQPRVADYIELLESFILDGLPKLSPKQIKTKVWHNV